MTLLGLGLSRARIVQAHPTRPRENFQIGFLGFSPLQLPIEDYAYCRDMMDMVRNAALPSVKLVLFLRLANVFHLETGVLDY